MLNKNIKKIIVGIIIVGELAALPLAAFAQAVPTCDPNTGSSCAAGYVAGIAANAGVQTAITAASAANLTCETLEQKYFNAGTTQQLGFSWLSVIGGSGVLVAKYDADLLAIDGAPGDTTVPPTGFIPCRKFVLGLLDKIVTPNAFLSNLKQTVYDSANKALVNLKAREESIKAKEANAKQGFWKTLVFNILIKTSKSVVNTLVGRLVNNYKINNIKQYVDSVATLMYDNQFLRDNFPNAQGQLMARAILENPQFRNRIQPGIFIAADTALGFDPKSLNPNDPNYYSKMAQIGSSQANPYFLQTSYVGGVDQSHALALAYSQNQISQGNGYKAPVNCSKALSDQKVIDGKTKAASDFLDDRQAQLNNLLAAQKLGQPVKQSDIDKAIADVSAAQNQWDNIPFAVAGKNAVSNLAEGGGNNLEGSMAIVMCEAISSPAILVNQGIDAAFKAAGAQMGQYDSNNLPGFINIIGDVASQIGSSLVLGGANGAKGSLLLNESKLANAAVGLANDYAASKAAANLAAQGVTFSVDPDNNGSLAGANSYTVNWQVSNDVINNANFVTISGDGITNTKVDPTTKQTVPNRLPLSGAFSIKTNVGGSYIITVFDSNGKALTSGTISVDTPGGGPAPSLSYNSGAPTVAGAYTEKPSLEIRGPAPHLSLRGE